MQGLAGTSEDGSFAYFVAHAALAAGATAGQDNLYLWHAGSTVFIAALSSKDTALADINNYRTGTADPYWPWSQTFAGRAARVSPDGRYVAFASSKQLTDLPIPPGPESVRTVEIYLYDSATRSLSCASCRSDGAVPVDPALVPVAPVFSGVSHQARWLNDRGHVFFSEEDLAPGASEGGLYEYEEAHIHLVAASHIEAGAPNVTFLDASETGSDVSSGRPLSLFPTTRTSWAISMTRA